MPFAFLLLRYASMRRVLGRVRLLLRLRAFESVDLHALVENSLDGRCASQFRVEVTGSENLGCKTDVGHRRRIAVAEPARLALLRKMRFERVERLAGPVL